MLTNVKLIKVLCICVVNTAFQPVLLQPLILGYESSFFSSSFSSSFGVSASASASAVESSM